MNALTPLDRPNSYIGRAVPRPNAKRLLTGRGRYVTDIVLPRMLHVAYVRSPYAHARIVSIDAQAARAMPGVKLIATGEGGFLLTNDAEIARFCRSFRTHWSHPSEPQQSYRHIGHNYRLAEILAWWGRKQVEIFEEVLEQRRWQASFLLARLRHTAGIQEYQPAPEERSNGFSPILLLDEQFSQREIARILAKRGVANSVGTFGLCPAQERPLFAPYLPEPVQTPNAQHFLSRVVAISLLPQYTSEDLLRIIDVIQTTLAEEQ